LGIAGISAAAIPLSLLWLFNSVWLGGKQEKLARAEATEVEAGQGSKLKVQA
jgi:hypothetical protein